jgi:cyanophycinase
VSRAFAFLGSGEFEPWTVEVDRWLLERADGDGPVLILPTASAAEGEEVFDGWASKGLEHFREIGVPARVAPIRAREDADREDVVALLRDASVAYFSGGNPWYLAQTLRGSAFCRALYERLDDGLAFAGCSAGVACLTETTYDTTVGEFASGGIWKPGLGYAREVLFAPHWDVVDTWVPGAQGFIAASVEPGQTLVAIDEDTAMLGDGRAWDVVGRSGVHVYRGGRWATHASGSAFELDLALAPPA